MSRTIKSPGGIEVRFIEAVNGFRSKFGHWPEAVETDAETIAHLATVSLTPLGFFLVQSKLDLNVSNEGTHKILARGRSDELFDYGEEGWQTDGHAHDARLWLGLD